jgi:hypothetical protein
MKRSSAPAVRRRAIYAGIALLGLAAHPVSAQQRSIVNPGFESNDPGGPGAPTYEILPAASVPGWESTTGFNELWDSGFNGVPAYEGAVFAEMNANAPGTLYQNVCLVNGEIMRWQFAHRARSGGPSTQTALFQIANPSGTVLQTLATQASTVSSNVWNVNTSPGAGVAYTGASGVQRIQFSTTDPGSFGNFLDGIQIFLSPYLELSGSTTSATEGAASPTLPSLTISGTVTSPISVTVNVTGGTATRGVDYTTPNGAASFTVAIPAGNYNQTVFPTGIAIIDDSALEANETILLNVAANPGSYTLAGTGSCGAAPNTALTHTIIDDDSRLTLRKQWSSAYVGDDANVTLTRGATVIRTLASDAGTSNELDTDTASVPVVIGETLTLAETLAGTNVGLYAGTVACTGAADTNLANGLTIATGETAIICTYTNVNRTPPVMTKSSVPVSDPVNGTTNPKYIPGASLDYTIVASNPGSPVSADTVVIVDPLPPNLRLYVGDLSGSAGTGPVVFTNGAPSSTLTYSYAGLANLTDDIDFSNNGGTSWTYVPVPSGVDGTDAAVNAIRIRPKGTMVFGGNFQVRFRMFVQ